MGFKGFRINVAARLVLLVALIGAFAFSLANAEMQVTPIVCAVLVVLVAAELIRYVESVNRELAGFLEFVGHHDFGASFPIGEKGEVFRRLEDAYKVLAQAFRDLNREKAAKHRYLEAVVEHVSTALVSFDDHGRVELMNRQAKALFKAPHLHDTRSFGKIDGELPELLETLDDGARALITVRLDGQSMQLVLYATTFELLDRGHKLVSFQDIRDELEQREIDFSQKLIKVLTHEIMNSVTPMISLSKVIEEALLEARDGKGRPRPPADEEDELLQSVASIRARGSGLLRFVQAYAAVANLPRPRFAAVDVAALLDQVDRLMRTPLESGRIALEIDVEEPGLSVRADPEQLQQVLINLVKNAAEALEGREGGRIVLSAGRDAHGKAVIEVSDDGPGIDPAHADSIFVPFFTTKRHGTGVGLTISRQIMFLNNGLISVTSTPGEGCRFTLRFR